MLLGLVAVVTAAAVIALQRMSCGGAAAPRQGCGLILRGRPGVYEGLRSWDCTWPSGLSGRCQKSI